MKSIQSDIVIMGIRSKVDGSIGFNASTPELTPEEKTEFFKLQSQNVIMTLVPHDESNAPKIKIEREMETKTPGQRLRNTIFVYWKQLGGRGEFDDYYKELMEGFINTVKAKLDPNT